MPFKDFIQNMSQALSKCLSKWIKVDKWYYLKNPSHKFRKSFCLGFLWIPRKTGRQDWRGSIPSMCVFISVLKWANLFCNISLLSELKKIGLFSKKIEPDRILSTNQNKFWASIWTRHFKVSLSTCSADQKLNPEYTNHDFFHWISCLSWSAQSIFTF